MIYLFCNSGFGRPFLEQGAAYCRQHAVPLTIVYSVNRRVARRTPLVRAAGRLREKFRHARLPRPSGARIVLAADVNRGDFIEAIHPGSDGIIAGFNQIFDEALIRRFGTLVNFHPSILPYYRGPVPSTWCIRNGEQYSGFTLHGVTTEIDRGPILYQERVEIDDLVDPATLDQRIARAAVPTLVRYLDHLATGAPWSTVELQADSVYRRPRGYAGFPSE